MTHNSETIVDENGIEILVGYKYDKTSGYYEEPENSASFVEPMVYTELESVEVVVAGVGIDILRGMTERQKEKIISLLNYE